ncbi:MAG: 16S rRNA processing protein RimM [Acidobacteria bacterium]|nr:16S rRNA processing protein RimM [Acidobacteriota bacterium]
MTASQRENASEYVAVARITRPQGRRGEVAAEILSDFPERLLGLKTVFLRDSGGKPEAMQVEDAWPHKGRIILKFSSVDSIDDAERLRGREVLIPRSERAPLGEHQYWVSDLEGCRVLVERDGTTTEVGRVVGVDAAGGAEVLRVESAQGEVLIPLAQEICTRIDTESKVIWIDPPEDLLKLNQKA